MLFLIILNRMLKCRTALCSGVVVTDARTQHARTGTVKKISSLSRFRDFR